MLNLQQNFRNFFGVDALPALDEVYFDEYQQAEDPRSKLFSIESTDRELIQTQEVTSLGLFTVTGEGEIANKDQFSQGYPKNFTVSKYAKAIGISDEMMADDRWALISKMVKSLARSAKETEIVLAMNVLNNAFGSEKSADGIAIISASHPSEVGNQSNTLSVAADLSYTSAQEMEKLFREAKDSRGKRLLLKPKVVLVSESERHNAIEIFQSPYKANTANNNVNSLGQGGQLEILSSPYLTDSDAWFMLADPMDHGLKIFERQKMSTKTSEDTLAGVLYYKAEFRQALGCDKWRGIAGTAGA
jgi:hypothetical protein